MTTTLDDLMSQLPDDRRKAVEKRAAELIAAAPLVQELTASIELRCPSLTVDLDHPGDSNGAWFLDVRLDDKAVAVVEHRPSRGFGVTFPNSDGDYDYSVGPDEVSGEIDVVVDWIAEEVKVWDLAKAYGMLKSDIRQMLAFESGKSKGDVVEVTEEDRISRVFKELRNVDHEALFLIRKGDARALREPWSRQLQNFVMLGLVELEPTLTEAGHEVLRKVVEARKAAGR